ncbi:exopolyphosphatase/guanosine-5'-triphosphate,3'-diphosphate pyrophosphatase [Neolewinella xylanilytica]|uniref:Exopolyphosphatase/guanosine-5'-triphosphate, 3'-diphosphate pyrophosphatase n=1 Tax=Neolewinella xylanilytica TaxID=1514080 RepID=A0A2S6I068_9BACT|nr:exopolyphosphatase [Neolewinella xylanilytica]PPK84072.1 exopolyphosphatase/guanosine-5'-triphosphate,3'-diphosphate pyrophosphatase [Neolewinella xylanilytica]
MSNETLRAVIDLGTNTFHLLIAAVEAGDRVREVYRERIFVKLASDGIETIGPEPFARGIEALHHFAAVISQHRVERVTAIGTAALRTATNGPVFVRTAEQQTGIVIRLIQGDLEAELITRGVLAALPPLQDRVMIMDIGGGSTEFIIASEAGVHWRQSFPIGVAVLQRRFHRTDPISEAEIRELDEYLTRTLVPLRDVLSEYPTHHLVGAAGTFDVLADVLRDVDESPHPTSHRLALGGLEALHFRIVASTIDERLAIEGVPAERADLIVVAMLLIRFVMQLAATERITVSDYAMKEGILLGTEGLTLE